MQALDVSNLSKNENPGMPATKAKYIK